MMIKIEQELNLVKLAQDAYDLSVPRGYGFLHYVAGPLSDEDAMQCITKDGDLSMDYVHGRGCKLFIQKVEGGYQLRDTWYDHTFAEFKELLARNGVTIESSGTHGISCACSECSK